jgi:hypothetical protein
MSNAFGLVLDSASVRRAAVEGVPETVIAAIYLLHENSVNDIASKLTPHELLHVIRLVGRCPTWYPPGTLAALKSWSLTRSHEQPRVGVSTDQASSQRAAHTGAERLQRYRAYGRKHTGRHVKHRQGAATSAIPTYGTRNGVTPTGVIAATTAEPVSASTLRVCRHRQRRRESLRLFTRNSAPQLPTAAEHPSRLSCG